MLLRDPVAFGDNFGDWSFAMTSSNPKFVADTGNREKVPDMTGANGHDGRIVIRSKSGTLNNMRGMLRRKGKRLTHKTIESWTNQARSRAWTTLPSRRRTKPR